MKLKFSIIVSTIMMSIFIITHQFEQIRIMNTLALFLILILTNYLIAVVMIRFYNFLKKRLN